MFISFIQCTGEWGEDEFCDPGEYAIGFQVHSHIDKDKDKHNCKYVHSPKEKDKDKENNEYAIGFQVHSYKDKDNCEYAHSHKENNEYMLLAFRHAFSSYSQHFFVI